MTDLQPVEQASRALLHILKQIRDNPSVGWYCGLGTQSFALLTEAYSTIKGIDLEEVREEFQCLDAKNPAAPEEDEE
ncbi:MAG TPA: hypothetical protein VF614_01710 [Chthoniobacteraceae bacterium]